MYFLKIAMAIFFLAQAALVLGIPQYDEGKPPYKAPEAALPENTPSPQYNTPSPPYNISSPQYNKPPPPPYEEPPTFAEIWTRNITCETSIGSPQNRDIVGAIRELEKRVIENNRGCRQTNGRGSMCTTLIKHEGAAIGVCGADEDPTVSVVPSHVKQLTCSRIVELAKAIHEKCQNGPGERWRVGGIFNVEMYRRVILFSSSHA